MNSSNRLIDIYMSKLSLRTLNDAAKKLGVTRPAVSNWRAGTSHPNAAAVEDMCKATGESLAKWLPLIEAERCRTDDDRKVWLRLAQVAASIAITVGLSIATPSTAHASEGFSAHNPSTLYIM